MVLAVCIRATAYKERPRMATNIRRLEAKKAQETAGGPAEERTSIDVNHPITAAKLGRIPSHPAVTVEVGADRPTVSRRRTC